MIVGSSLFDGLYRRNGNINVLRTMIRLYVSISVSEFDFFLDLLKFIKSFVHSCFRRDLFLELSTTGLRNYWVVYMYRFDWFGELFGAFHSCNLFLYMYCAKAPLTTCFLTIYFFIFNKQSMFVS